jgi:hypothetical protein
LRPCPCDCLLHGTPPRISLLLWSGSCCNPFRLDDMFCVGSLALITSYLMWLHISTRNLSQHTSDFFVLLVFGFFAIKKTPNENIFSSRIL